MARQQALLLQVLCFFWIIIRVLSHKVWLTESRTFPIIAPFSIVDSVSAQVNAALYFVSLAGLGLLLVFPKNRTIMAATLIVIISSCFLDVMCWQVWEYLFTFILLVCAVQIKNLRGWSAALLIVFSSVYIYGGLQKLNGGFLSSVWERLILKDMFGLSGSFVTNAKLHYVGLLVPVIEAALGVLLLFMKNRKKPAMALIGMHLFILAFMFNKGAMLNAVAIAWNVAMILFLHLLFVREKAFQFKMADLKGFTTMIAVVWGILPALNFIGYWDDKFSSGMYSGKDKKLVICIDDEVPEEVKPYLAAADAYNLCSGAAMVNVSKWAITEMGVNPGAEEWYFKKLKEKWEKSNPKVNAKFVMYSYPYNNAKEIR
ncbi:MAG: hypothetical protein EOO45_22990 [Flavobacterium sp.]|nr:MAG: hypothetical protein EOO45_22990 [Flavobacterium sp.]